MPRRRTMDEEVFDDSLGAELREARAFREGSKVGGGFGSAFPPSQSASGLEDISSIFTLGGGYIDLSGQSIDIYMDNTGDENILNVFDSDGSLLSGIDSRGIIFSHADGTSFRTYFAGGAGVVDADAAAQNVGIGWETLSSLTTADANVGVGHNALKAVEDGSNNVGLGHGVGGALVDGKDNTYTGKSSGGANISGDDNAGYGAFSLWQQLGFRNTAVGSDSASGAPGATANDGSYFGFKSGFRIDTGDRNIFLGAYSGARQTTNSDLLIIDNRDRADVATELSHAIIYGVMGANPEDQSLRFNADTFTFGTDADSDVAMNFIANSNSGLFTWMEDEDAFVFGDDVVINDTQQTNAGIFQIGGGWTFKESAAPTADVGYGKIWTDTDNELWFQSGDGASHLLHGDAFSNIWFHAASTVEVTIAAQNAFTLIDSFTVVGNEDDLSNVVGSAANNNLVLSSIAGGEYEISFHASMTATGGADKEMIVCLGIILDTPKDITNVTDDTVSPIVITSTAHGFEDGDMVEIAGVLVNTAANGSFIVDNKTANTFEIVDLSGGATTGNGDYDEGTPTGDVTIWYPGNMIVHRMVRGADLGALSATGLHILSNSDNLALYVANLSGLTNLTVAAVSLDADRIGD